MGDFNLKMIKTNNFKKIFHIIFNFTKWFVMKIYIPRRKRAFSCLGMRKKLSRKVITSVFKHSTLLKSHNFQSLEGASMKAFSLQFSHNFLFWLPFLCILIQHNKTVDSWRWSKAYFSVENWKNFSQF